MFSLISAWTKVWANRRDAGNLRRHRAHYDVTLIISFDGFNITIYSKFHRMHMHKHIHTYIICFAFITTTVRYKFMWCISSYFIGPPVARRQSYNSLQFKWTLLLMTWETDRYGIKTKFGRCRAFLSWVVFWFYWSALIQDLTRRWICYSDLAIMYTFQNNSFWEQNIIR